MNYTVIFSNGRILTFFLKATAECYANAYDGTLVTEQILVDIPLAVTV